MIILFNNLLSSAKEITLQVFEIIAFCLPGLLVIEGIGGAIFCIIKGIKCAKCEDEEEHIERKNKLKKMVFGLIILFLLLVLIKVGVEVVVKTLSGEGY